MLQTIKQIVTALSFASAILYVKPTAVKVIAFHNAATNEKQRAKAVGAAAEALGNIGDAANERENADALLASAKEQAQSVVDDFVAADLLLEARASEGTMRKEIQEALRALTDSDGEQRFTDAYIANLLGDFANAVNVKPHKFIINHQRTNARKNGTGKKRGGAARLVEKSDSSYSLNAKVNTPTTKLVTALKQFGNWIASTAKAEDKERLALASYLKDCDDVAAQ
jgi:hypothetical protein